MMAVVLGLSKSLFVPGLESIQPFITKYDVTCKGFCRLPFKVEEVPFCK